MSAAAFGAASVIRIARFLCMSGRGVCSGPTIGRGRGVSATKLGTVPYRCAIRSACFSTGEAGDVMAFAR